jgi:hypothetical protein
MAVDMPHCAEAPVQIVDDAGQRIVIAQVVVLE